jgi:hypothetical protein
VVTAVETIFASAAAWSTAGTFASAQLSTDAEYTSTAKPVNCTVVNTSVGSDAVRFENAFEDPAAHADA